MVAIVAIDGVRYQEVFGGADPKRVGKAERARLPRGPLMPKLTALLETRGAILGAPGLGPAPRASGPNYVSLPGYSEMLSGRGPSDCEDNECSGARAATLLDQAARGFPAGEVAVFSSWPSIARVAAKDADKLVMSCGRTGGRQLSLLKRSRASREWLERGRRASPKPSFGEFRPDRYTAGLALSYLQEHKPSLMFMSLGETDEYAHQNKYREYLGAMSFADEVIGRLWSVLEKFEAQGHRVTLLVTTDHGREAEFVQHGRQFPDSGRVWIAAVGSTIGARGYVVSRREHRLAELVPTVQDLLGLPARVPGQRTRALAELELSP